MNATVIPITNIAPNKKLVSGLLNVPSGKNRCCDANAKPRLGSIIAKLLMNSMVLNTLYLSSFFSRNAPAIKSAPNSRGRIMNSAATILSSEPYTTSISLIVPSHSITK